ncbi:helix-turn-helix domain-containing protein [Aureimonas sp. AU40]|uniref:helix-turn-helix domain-containing protein n=1 Tax=Aureimonas sp. AU40 TaxID=1637747 RepID=UPI00078294FF|nr:helix-turn-helix transcriptional regulator [Aureimonas sp. AU40]
MSRYSPLGLAFRRLRDERGLTQVAMAAALSVPAYWLSRLEGGREELTEAGVEDAIAYLKIDGDEADAVRTAWEASRLPVGGVA